MSWADASRSLIDLIFDGTTAALKNAGVEMAQVDSVVLGAHDLVDGLSLSSMVTSPAAGAYLRDEIRLSEDGLVAASLAAARVASGESKLSVVAAWGRASEGDFLNTSRAAMDPFLLQPLGVTELDVSALRLCAWAQNFPRKEQQRKTAAAERHSRARRNRRAIHQTTAALPLNYPLMPEEGPVWTDIVVALLIGTAESPIRVAGVGHSTDLPMLGDRDLLARPALKEATARALQDADTKQDKIDVVEIDGITLVDEVLGLESLGFFEAGKGFESFVDAKHINASGGGAAGWCYPAMGLARLAECYFQLKGQAGDIQIPGSLKRALAIGSSPVGAQTNTAMILEAQ